MSCQRGMGSKVLQDFQDSIASVIPDETSQLQRLHVENTQSKEANNEKCTVVECVILKENRINIYRNIYI